MNSGPFFRARLPPSGHRHRHGPRPNAFVQPLPCGLTHEPAWSAAAVSERVAPGSFGRDLSSRSSRRTIFRLRRGNDASCRIPRPCTGFCRGLTNRASKGALLGDATGYLRLVARQRAVLAVAGGLATVPLRYGATKVFHLNESFLTQRLAAVEPCCWRWMLPQVRPTFRRGDRGRFSAAPLCHRRGTGRGGSFRRVSVVRQVARDPNGALLCVASFVLG